MAQKPLAGYSPSANHGGCTVLVSAAGSVRMNAEEQAPKLPPRGLISAKNAAGRQVEALCIGKSRFGPLAPPLGYQSGQRWACGEWGVIEVETAPSERQEASLQWGSGGLRLSYRPRFGLASEEWAAFLEGLEVMLRGYSDGQQGVQPVESTCLGSAGREVEG